MTITLRQLTYLQAVAEAGHFGRAAERCAVSQPALSMQIRLLEDQLGLQLFERRAKGAVLTATGEELLKRARGILVQVRELTDYARQAQAPLSGELRLGVIPTIAPYLLPTVLPALAKRYEALHLRLRESQTAAITRELAAGTLDAVLCALPIDHDGFETMSLFDDEFLLCVPDKHKLAKKREVPVSSLTGERVLLLEEGHCFRDQALSFCTQADPGLIDEFGATSFATIVQLVASGFGLTLLPKLAAPVETGRRADIKLVRFGAPRPHRRIGLAWRKSSPRQRDFELLGDAIKSMAP